jgi:UDP-GlcNAc:undecaprenyl-phosphate/decaprenyl-phosphate GlcNAc-1-phosphate transferase
MGLSILWVVLSTIVVGLYASPIAKFFGVMDIPGGRKKHNRETPLVGGIAVCLAILPILPFFFEKFLVGATISLTTFLLLILGVRDDHQHLRPSFRLAYSFIVMTVAIWLVPELSLETLKLSFMKDTMSLSSVSIPFTLICLVGLQNAINMADGKNGIVLGLSIIWATSMAVHAPLNIATVLWISILAMMIVMAFNLKGRLFLGDGGTYALSILWGMFAIYMHQIVPAAIPGDLVVLWFIIPVLDCIRLIVSRVINGQSPFEGDRNHLHHLIFEVMPSWKYGLMIYLSMVGLPIVAASYFPAYTVLITLGMVGVYMLMYVSFNNLASINKSPAE